MESGKENKRLKTRFSKLRRRGIQMIYSVLNAKNHIAFYSFDKHKRSKIICSEVIRNFERFDLLNSNI